MAEELTVSQQLLHNDVPAALRSGKPARKFPCHPALRAQRNLAIFHKVEIEHFSHQEVARLFRLRRSRVSQIVKQVRNELAEISAGDSLNENHLAQQRLQRKLEKLRLEFALAATAQALRSDPSQLVTSRKGSRDKDGAREDWNETITRDKPSNLQLVKTFLRVNRDLGLLNEREIAANPISPKLKPLEMFQAITNLLSEWRYEKSIHEDPPSDAFMDMVKQFEQNVYTWIHNIRRGASARDAWPPPEPPQRLNPASAINHQAQNTNLALTSEGHFDDSATTYLSET